MKKIPFLVDLMQTGDIIKARFVVWLYEDVACPNAARQQAQLFCLGKVGYEPDRGDTFVAERLPETDVWRVW